MSRSDESYRILSLDGGGYKGIFSAVILREFERDLGKNIRDEFDLIVGTSTGGIIALALAADYSLDEIVNFYERYGEDIFKKNYFNSFKRLISPKYAVSTLKDVLFEFFDNKTLGDLEKDVVIPSYNIQSNDVHIFKTPHHKNFSRDESLLLADVALATSAAPTYFSAHTIQSMKFIDGGVWSNNPSMVGLTEAIKYKEKQLSGIKLLSIGTTQEMIGSRSHLYNGGLFQWAKHIPNVLMSAQSKSSHNTVRHLLPKENYLRIDQDVAKHEAKLDLINAENLIGRAAKISRDFMPKYRSIFENK